MIRARIDLALSVLWGPEGREREESARALRNLSRRLDDKGVKDEC